MLDGGSIPPCSTKCDLYAGSIPATTGHESARVGSTPAGLVWKHRLHLMGQTWFRQREIEEDDNSAGDRR